MKYVWVGIKDVYYLCADFESNVIYGLFVFFALAKGSYPAYLSMSLLPNTNEYDPPGHECVSYV